MNVFIDTSFYIARIMVRDQWHGKALRAVRPGINFFTSSLIVNETVSLLQARGPFSAAVDFLREARLNPHVLIIYPDAAIQSDAWDLFARWGPAGANAVDCVSFAIMRRLAIRKAPKGIQFRRAFQDSGLRHAALRALVYPQGPGQVQK